MYCSKCGASIDETGGYCRQCGNRIIPVTVEAKEIAILPAASKKINPHLYTVSLWGGLAALIMAAVWADDSEMLSAAMTALGLCSLFFAYVYSLKCLHRCWAILQPFNARTTPNRAVGYLFIPLFNLYWAFVALRGLAFDANEFSSQVGSNVRISKNLSSAVPILILIPYMFIICPIIINILVYQWAAFQAMAMKLDWSAISVDLRHRSQKESKLAFAFTAVFIIVFSLGILAAIAIPNFVAFRDRGYIATMRSECSMIKTAEEAFFEDHETYLSTTNPEADLKEYGVPKLTSSAVVLADESRYVILMESNKTAKKLKYDSAVGTMEMYPGQ